MHHNDVSDFAHSHNFLSAYHDANERRTRYVVMLTAAMMFVEIVAGLLTGSMALLADGIHMAACWRTWSCSFRVLVCPATR